MCVYCVTCVSHINAFICKCCVCPSVCERMCVFVCVGGWRDECVPARGRVCKNRLHSYVNRQCMCACICRRDPYHGIMRSATVGYPQTVVIMAAAKRTDAEGRTDVHTLTYSTTHGPVWCH